MYREKKRGSRNSPDLRDKKSVWGDTPLSEAHSTELEMSVECTLRSHFPKGHIYLHSFQDALPLSPTVCQREHNTGRLSKLKVVYRQSAYSHLKHIVQRESSRRKFTLGYRHSLIGGQSAQISRGNKRNLPKLSEGMSTRTTSPPLLRGPIDTQPNSLRLSNGTADSIRGCLGLQGDGKCLQLQRKQLGKNEDLRALGLSTPATFRANSPCSVKANKNSLPKLRPSTTARVKGKRKERAGRAVSPLRMGEDMREKALCIYNSYSPELEERGFSLSKQKKREAMSPHLDKGGYTRGGYLNRLRGNGITGIQNILVINGPLDIQGIKPQIPISDASFHYSDLLNLTLPTNANTYDSSYESNGNKRKCRAILSAIRAKNKEIKIHLNGSYASKIKSRSPPLIHKD